MTWSLPTTNGFYKFCSTFGLVIMTGPATVVIILTLYTTDMFEKVEFVTTTLQEDMGHQERLDERIEKNLPGSTLIEEKENLVREKTANLMVLKKELAKQNVTLEKAKKGLRYLTIALLPTAILFGVGGVLAFFGYK